MALLICFWVEKEQACVKWVRAWGRTRAPDQVHKVKHPLSEYVFTGWEKKIYLHNLNSLT